MTLRKHKRKDYEGINSVYMTTCNELEEQNKYIIGKAIELKDRLGSYNKVSNFNINIRKCLTRAVPHPNRVATPKTTIRNCARKTQSTEAPVCVSTPSVPSVL